MNSKVNYFFRKSRLGANSIEELFSSIIKATQKSIEVEKIMLPNSGAGLLTILSNLKYALKFRRQLVHITGDVHYLAIVTGKKTVLTIHDVQSILKGNVLKQLYLKLFWFWLPSLFVSKITVISEFSKMELLKIIPWAKKKVIVVHNPVNAKILEQSNFVVDSQNPVNGMFKILLLGTKENKNLYRTIDALSVLPCELIIIGALNEKQKEKLEEAKLSYQNPVNIPFQEVINWYKQCDIVCFASTYEGFGMPIIEAQALGKPIVTSNIAAMPEIALDSAVLVNPLDVQSIRDGISSLLFDEKFRKEKIQMGYQNIKRFEMKEISKQYLKIYEDL